MNKYSLEASFTILLVITILLVSSCNDTNSLTDANIDNEIADISGSVVTEDTFEGLGDVLVRLSQNGNSIDSIYTAESGEFSFKDIKEGEYQVDVVLPQGFEISGSSSKNVSLAGNNTTVDFSAIPIKEQTEMVEQGSVETLTVSSGASITIDASSFASDIEVSIEEVQENQNSYENVITKPVRITINAGSSTSKFKSNSSLPLLITINQEIFQDDLSNNARLNFLFDFGDNIVSAYSYADGQVKEVKDRFTGKVKRVLERTYNYLPGSNFVYVVSDNVDETCGVEYRDLYEVQGTSFQGDIPLILVHGVQLDRPNCENYVNYKPEEGFSNLITELSNDSEISNKYKLYIYKYTSNTRIYDNSHALNEKILLENFSEKPVIIAHSMGGLVTRGMMELYGDNTIEKLITLGTPHLGTPLPELFIDDVKRLKMKIKLNCDSPDDALIGIYCNMLSIGEVLPITPGLEDLSSKVNRNEIIGNLENNEKTKNNIYTLGGYINTFNEISGDDSKIQGVGFDLIFSAPWLYMKEELGLENDTNVPLKNALPEWSNLQYEANGYDHFEVYKGNNNDLFEVFNQIKPILIESTANPENSLIASYPFNGNANDESGNGYDGVVDGPTLTSDRFGNPNSAYLFQGDGGIEIGVVDALQISGDVSVSGWFKVESLPPSNYIIFDNLGSGETLPTNDLYFLDVHSDGRLRTGHEYGNGTDAHFFTTNPVIESEVWYHFSLLRNNSSKEYKIYLNNDLIEVINFEILPEKSESNNIQELFIGSRRGISTDFVGIIDDLRIHNYPISETQISDLYFEGGWTSTDNTGDWQRDTTTDVVEVTNPVTGRTWMDRNLGASRAATSPTDEQAFGDLYQWGRPADGHQIKNSNVTSNKSSVDQPEHGDFIRAGSSEFIPLDWRNPQNNELWQGSEGVNNPCPIGYRLPTIDEWKEERNSWNSDDLIGAFDSPLRLTVPGIRITKLATYEAVGVNGYYWSSSTNEVLEVFFSSYLYISATNIATPSNPRAAAQSVRCIKN